jgi:hypothetical protein
MGGGGFRGLSHIAMKPSTQYSFACLFAAAFQSIRAHKIAIRAPAGGSRRDTISMQTHECVNSLSISDRVAIEIISSRSINVDPRATVCGEGLC